MGKGEVTGELKGTILATVCCAPGTWLQPQLWGFELKVTLELCRGSSVRRRAQKQSRFIVTVANSVYTAEETEKGERPQNSAESRP